MKHVYLQRDGRDKSKRTGRAVYQRKKAYRFPALVHSLRELYKHFPTDAAIVDLGKSIAIISKR